MAWGAGQCDHNPHCSKVEAQCQEVPSQINKWMSQGTCWWELSLFLTHFPPPAKTARSLAWNQVKRSSSSSREDKRKEKGMLMGSPLWELLDGESIGFVPHKWGVQLSSLWGGAVSKACTFQDPSRYFSDIAKYLGLVRADFTGI